MGYTTEQKIGDWEVVGVIGVDAGLCWVGDPCYVREGIPERVFDQNKEAQEHPEGVCVSSGLGDGSYEVSVRYVEMPFWGKRIAEMKVTFISEETLERAREDEEGDDERG